MPGWKRKIRIQNGFGEGLQSPLDAVSCRDFSRGDKTAIELFLGGIRGWEARIRRLVGEGKTVVK